MATPDAIAAPEYAPATDQPGAVLVEAKTSANDDEWGRPGTDEIPTHYLTQCYWAMHVSGVHETRVPVLTSRLRFEEYVVQHDPEVGKLLEERCREFYDTLTADTPPPLDDSVSTLDCMKRLHPDIEAGLTVEVPADLAGRFLTVTAAIAVFEEQVRGLRSELYELAGRAQYLMSGGTPVARRQANKSGVSLVRVASELLPTESDAA